MKSIIKLKISQFNDVFIDILFLFHPLVCVRIIGLALQHVPNNSLEEVKTKVALQLVFRLIIVNKQIILH